MDLAALVSTSQQVAGVRSRLKKIELLAAALRGLGEAELDIAVAFLLGETRQGRIGLGAAAVRAALAEDAAGEAGAELSLADVDACFARIGSMSGAGSKAAKHAALGELFAGAGSEVARQFVARLVLGELRQGALEGLLIEAVAAAGERAPSAVRRATMLGGSLRQVALAALHGGSLDAFRLQVLRPVQPMLAQSAASPEAALEKLERAAFEWKLDGARVQVHRSGDEVRVFTRQLHDVTKAVPEVVEAARALPAATCVLDGEAIALEPGGRPRPFQVTLRRFGRRIDVEALRAELPLAVFFFDLLQLDGEDWIDRPYLERQERLRALVPAAQQVPSCVADSADAAEAFFAAALQSGHEGVMAKALDAPYEAGSRGGAWIKVKPAHTLDLVVLGAEWGSGRRRGTLSNLHLGARDAESGGFVMVGKTFKGMTDAVLAWQTEALQQIALGGEAQGGHVVYVRPELVVEVALDGVQASRTYPGGAALRFARLRGYREDKRADEVDTIDAVRALGKLAEPEANA